MAFQGDSIFWVEVNKIVANPYQPRREFDEQKLKELSESIRMYGILQPLTVTKREIQTENGAFYSEYELIAGERRWRASKLAGLEQVPVIIRDGNDTEQEKLELAIIENLQREDLNAVDRALAFKQLADMFELSHAQVAQKVGRSREYVSNTIRLLMLPEYMLSSIKVGDISEGHARSLLMLKDRPEEQDVVYREILLKKLSVREVERIARKIASDKVRKKNWANTDPELIEIEREFTDTLGTRVQISKTDFGGKLTIDYFSDEDLHNLLLLVKSHGSHSKLSDNENDDDVDDGRSTVMQAAGAAIMAKLSQATPLEMVEDINEGEKEREVVHDVIEDTTVNVPEVTTEEPVKNQLSEVEQTVSEPVKSDVAPSSWSFSFLRSISKPEAVATETVSVSEPAVPKPVAAESKPTTSATPSIAPAQQVSAPVSVSEPKPVGTPSETESDDDLYSIRNFSL